MKKITLKYKREQNINYLRTWGIHSVLNRSDRIFLDQQFPVRGQRPVVDDHGRAVFLRDDQVLCSDPFPLATEPAVLML